MEEMSGNVQNAALTCCDAEIKSTRKQPVSSRGRWNVTRGFDYAQKLTKPCDNTPPAVSMPIPMGRWNVTHGFDSAQNSRSSATTQHQQSAYQWGDGTLHMGSIRGKAHRLPNTHMATVSTPVGQWRKCLGKGRTQAHIFSEVVMDVAAFKVGHSVG